MGSVFASLSGASRQCENQTSYPTHGSCGSAGQRLEEAPITEGLAAVCTDSQLSMGWEIDFLGKPSGSTDDHPSYETVTIRSK